LENPKFTLLFTETGVSQLSKKEDLEIQIERLRTEMYHAYTSETQYDKVLQISQELDTLLNELDNLDNGR